jgi:hypothetical protein
MPTAPAAAFHQRPIADPEQASDLGAGHERGGFGGGGGHVGVAWRRTTLSLAGAEGVHMDSGGSGELSALGGELFEDMRQALLHGDGILPGGHGAASRAMPSFWNTWCSRSSRADAVRSQTCS